MKKQIGKRQIVFIGIILLSLGCSFSFAQNCNPAKPCPNGYSCVNGLCKKTVYFCNCGLHGYGCGVNTSCRTFCSNYCRSWIAVRENGKETYLAGVYYCKSELSDKNFEKSQQIFQWNDAETKDGIYILKYESESLSEIQKLSVVR